MRIYCESTLREVICLEKIISRQDFNEVDMGVTPYIFYDVDDVTPSSEDFIYGETRTIVLRNRDTGHLERIKFKLLGIANYPGSLNAYWYWGKICQHAILAFNFRPDGTYEQAVVIFCGDDVGVDELEKILNTYSAFPAEFTAANYFTY